jgi:hypothetical protein
MLASPYGNDILGRHSRGPFSWNFWAFLGSLQTGCVTDEVAGDIITALACSKMRI